MTRTASPATKASGRGVKDISATRLAQLNAGAPASTLTECLAVDFAALMQAVAPEIGAEAIAQMRAEAATGISQAHGGGGTDPGRLPRSAGRCAIQDPRIRHRARLGLLPGWRIAGRVLASPPGPYPPLGGRRPFRRARMGVAGAAPAPGRRRGNVSTGATAVDPGPIRACAPFRQRIPASARGLVRPHRGAEVGPGHRAAAVGAATRRPSGLCPGFGGELAERCQQGPACMGARPCVRGGWPASPPPRPNASASARCVRSGRSGIDVRAGSSRRPR